MTVELNYFRKGSGEPVVLMHGIGHRWQAFEAIIDRLAAKYDVIAVDAAGFGESPALPKGTSYSIASLADVVADNYKIWGIENPHVVGNSMGGSEAICLGQTGRARSVTALSPGGYFGPIALAAAGLPLFNLKLGAYLPTWFLDAFSKTAFGRFYIGMALYWHPMRFTADQVYGDSLAMKGATGFWPMIWAFIKDGFKRASYLQGRAKVPTVIGWAKYDFVLWPYQGRRAAKALRGSQFSVIEDAGHVSMGDNPDAVVALIESAIALSHVADADAPDLVEAEIAS